MPGVSSSIVSIPPGQETAQDLSAHDLGFQGIFASGNAGEPSLTSPAADAALTDIPQNLLILQGETPANFQISPPYVFGANRPIGAARAPISANLSANTLPNTGMTTTFPTGTTDGNVSIQNVDGNTPIGGNYPTE